jgi:hypothetical protein
VLGLADAGDGDGRAAAAAVAVGGDGVVRAGRGGGPGREGGVLETRLKRMQYRPRLLEGFLASTGLDLTPFL